MSTYTASQGVTGFKLPVKYDYESGIRTNLITMPQIDLDRYKRYAPAAFIPAISILLGSALLSPPFQNPQPSPQPGGTAIQSDPDTVNNSNTGSSAQTLRIGGTGSSNNPAAPTKPDGAQPQTAQEATSQSPLQPAPSTPPTPPVGGRGAGTVWDVTQPTQSPAAPYPSNDTVSESPASTNPNPGSPNTEPAPAPIPDTHPPTLEAEVQVGDYKAKAGVDVVDPSVTLESNLTDGL